MSTHPPLMATEAVIAACAEAGESVSVTQLGRWVRAGLIPAHLRQRRSRGRGKGIEWLWQPECANRAIIIARTVQVGKQSDPSLHRAALALALLGYELAAQPLRDLLIRGAIEFEQSLQKRQPYLRDGGVPDAPQRVQRRFRRQLPTAPDATIQTLTAIEISMHDLPQSGVSPLQADAAAIFSLPRLSSGLIKVDDATLLTAYVQANHFAPAFSTLDSFLTRMQEGLLASPQTFSGLIEVGILDAVPPEARIGLMRLVLTAVLAVYPDLLRADARELQERTGTFVQMIMDILPGAGLSQYLEAWQTEEVSAEAANGKEPPMD